MRWVSRCERECEELADHSPGVVDLFFDGFQQSRVFPLHLCDLDNMSHPQ